MGVGERRHRNGQTGSFRITAFTETNIKLAETDRTNFLKFWHLIKKLSTTKDAPTEQRSC